MRYLLWGTCLKYFTAPLSEPFFKILQGVRTASLRIGQPALDSFERLQFVELIQESLVGGCVLDHDLNLPVVSQNDWMTARPHPLK